MTCRTMDELRKFYQDNCSTFLNTNPKVELTASILESLANVFHILAQTIEKGLNWDEQPKV